MLENVADQRQQRLMATGVVLCLEELLSLLCFGNFLRELILKTIEHLNSPCVFDIMNPSLEILSHLLDPNRCLRNAKAFRKAHPRVRGLTAEHHNRWALWIQLLKEHCRGSRENRESVDLQLWPWLPVITGYFYGIIHSINGVISTYNW